jgi:hypothetical protein
MNQDLLDRIDFFYDTHISNKIINKALCFTDKRFKELMKPKQHVKKDLLHLLYISSNFIMRKEETIEEIANMYELKVSRRLIDGLIKQIASTYEDSGNFTIGTVCFKDPIDFINTLRNKFAHGNYKYNYENYTVKIKANGGEIVIPLNWLITFNRLVLVEVNKIKNDGHYQEGILKVQKNSFTKISSYNDFKRAFTNLKYYEFTVTPINMNDSFEEYQNGLISEALKLVRDDFDQEKNPDGTIRQIEKWCESKGLKLEVRVIPVSCFSQEEKEKLKNIYHNTPLFNEYDEGGQLYTLCQWISDIKVNINSVDHISQGYTVTQNFIDYADYEKSYDMFIKKYPIDALYYDKCIISGILSQFNIVYAYNAELIFEKYLDYAKLDLSKIKYTINKFEDTELAFFDKQLETLKNKIDNVNVEVTKVEGHLNKLLIAVNQKGESNDSHFKGKKVLNEKLEFEKVKLAIIEKEYQQILIKRLARMDEISKNAEYYKNKNIITHIRNSLAHGNFEVQRFSKQGNFGKATIHIQDIFMGENTFDLEITLDDFISLFSAHNYKVLFDMYDDVIKEYFHNNLKEKNNCFVKQQ